MPIIALIIVGAAAGLIATRLMKVEASLPATIGIGILGGRPRWDSTVIVFLADHGDELYEHGSWLHGQSLYEELLHVPLVLRIPGLTDAGARIPQPVSVIDVPPNTIFRTGAPSTPLRTRAPACARISLVCAPFSVSGL